MLDTNQVQKKSPTKAFVLSLLGGVMILGGGASRIVVMMFAFSSVLPNIIDPAYMMMQAIGAVGGLAAYAIAAVEAISGIFVILGALMVHHQPTKAAKWANLILAFSFVSLVGTGGLLLGAVLAIIGGLFALIQKPNPPGKYSYPWRRAIRRVPS